MKEIIKEVFINAPKQKVWEYMLSDAGYRDWVSVFHAGSYAETDWKEGSKVKFIDDSHSGVFGFIKENRPYDTIAFEYIGLMDKGNEDTESEWAKMYAGLIERYTFNEEDGGTLLHIEAGMEDSMFDEMNIGWDKALTRLKEGVESKK